MTVRLIYSRPLPACLASDRSEVAERSLLGRLARLVLEALHRSRAKTAARELRRHLHLAHNPCDPTQHPPAQ